MAAHYSHHSNMGNTRWAGILSARVSHSSPAFTIVELLIVIVIIAILATITVVAFNGLQSRAKNAQVVSAVDQASKKVRVSQLTNSALPATLADAGIGTISGVTLTYTIVDSETYCVTAKSSTDATIVAGRGTNGNCGQLSAVYFNNMDLSGNPVLSRVESGIDYNWGSGSPGPGVNTDSISGRWIGNITAPTTDTYTLYIWEDDKSRIYLNNVLVADHWSDACCTWRSFTYSFIANQTIPLRVEWAEGGGGAGVRLQWAYTGQSQTAIPPYAFSN